MARRVKIAFFIVLPLVVIGGAVVVYIFVSNQTVKVPSNSQSLAIDYDKKAAELAQEEPDANVATIVDEYGPSYYTSLEDITTTESSKWTPEQITKAYICLLYSEKIGSYTQVLDIISRIENAERKGLKVDNNGAKVTKEQRAEIKRQAEELQAKNSKKGIE